jgi:hypothetical protein
VAVLAQRPSVSIVGFRVHVSVDDVVYDPIAGQKDFAAYGKIVNATYDDTTDDLDESVGVQVEMFGPDDIQSQTDTQRDDDNLLAFFGDTGEIASCGAMSNLGSGVKRVYLRRRLYGTAKASHAIGTEVWFIQRSQLVPVSNVAFVADATVFFKLQTLTATQELPIDDAPAFSTIISGASVAEIPPPRFDRPGGIGDANQGASFGADGADFGALFIQMESGTPAGSVVFWNTTNTDATESDPAVVYGTNIGLVIANITGNVTVTAAVRGPDGRWSRQRRATFTRVPQTSGTPVTPQVATPAFGKSSGTWGHTAVSGRITCATAGATIKYDKGAGTVTYTAGTTVSLLVGDTIDIWAEKSGFTTSETASYDNIDPNI